MPHDHYSMRQSKCQLPVFYFRVLDSAFIYFAEFFRRDFLFWRVFMGLIPAETARPYPPPRCVSLLLEIKNYGKSLFCYLHLRQITTQYRRNQEAPKGLGRKIGTVKGNRHQGNRNSLDKPARVEQHTPQSRPVQRPRLYRGDTTNTPASAAAGRNGRFQSTLPVRGATLLGNHPGPVPGDFNPRSPCGERPTPRTGKT